MLYVSLASVDRGSFISHSGHRKTIHSGKHDVEPQYLALPHIVNIIFILASISDVGRCRPIKKAPNQKFEYVIKYENSSATFALNIDRSGSRSLQAPFTANNLIAQLNTCIQKM